MGSWRSFATARNTPMLQTTRSTRQRITAGLTIHGMVTYCWKELDSENIDKVHKPAEYNNELFYKVPRLSIYSRTWVYFLVYLFVNSATSSQISKEVETLVQYLTLMRIKKSILHFHFHGGVLYLFLVTLLQLYRLCSKALFFTSLFCPSNFFVRCGDQLLACHFIRISESNCFFYHGFNY